MFKRNFSNEPLIVQLGRHEQIAVSCFFKTIDTTLSDLVYKFMLASMKKKKHLLIMDILPEAASESPPPLPPPPPPHETEAERHEWEISNAGR
jgi:hypothetical protein